MSRNRIAAASAAAIAIPTLLLSSASAASAAVVDDERANPTNAKLTGWADPHKVWTWLEIWNSNLELHDGELNTYQFYGTPDIRSNIVKDITKGDRGMISHIEGFGPTISHTYQIYDHGVATGFWLRATIGTDLIFGNTPMCNIYKGNPNKGGIRTDLSGFKCSMHDTSGSVFNPTIRVEREATTVVSDKAQQKQMLENDCGDPSKCRFEPTKVEHGVKGTEVVPKQITIFKNSSGAPVSRTFWWENTFGWENNVSASASATGTIKVVELALELGYSHTWSAGTTFHDEATFEVPANSYGWVTAQTTVVKTTGDMIVRKNGVNYRLTNVTFTAPEKDGRAYTNIKTCPVADFDEQTMKCSSNPDVF